jgi:hypothetical protein
MAHAQLIITFEDNGSVSVSGAIDNKLISFGMLECAKEAISEFHRNKAKSGLVVPLHPIPPSNGHAS